MPYASPAAAYAARCNARRRRDKLTAAAQALHLWAGIAGLAFVAFAMAFALLGMLPAPIAVQGAGVGAGLLAASMASLAVAMRGAPRRPPASARRR